MRVLPESEDKLKKKKKDGVYKSNNRSQFKNALNGQNWVSFSNKISQAVLDYNSKYKKIDMNIHLYKWNID